MGKITTKQRERLTARSRAGEDVKALAAEYGVCVSHVYRLRGYRPGMRGFRGMVPELQREIAGRGGRRAHEVGTAHEFTAEEAREAGKKGGASLARDRGHMVEIGAAGGRKSGGRKR